MPNNGSATFLWEESARIRLQGPGVVDLAYVDLVTPTATAGARLTSA